MNYNVFKNKHINEKIIVCGCGTSLNTFSNPEQFITIGVNDVERYTYEKDGIIKHFIPNYLVILNDEASFKPGRWEWIKNTNSQIIFTHLPKIKLDEEKKVIIKLGKYGGFDLEKESVDYTTNSTYVACIIAAYMGASKIGLIGCDFTENHFFGETGEHMLSKRLNLINQEFSNLNKSLKQKQIEFVNLSESSKVEIKKQDIKLF